MFRIKDIPNGSIVWKGYKILGIKGATLKEEYFDYYCTKIQGNPLDYEFVNKKVSEGDNE